MKNYLNLSTTFLQIVCLVAVVGGAIFLFSGSISNTAKVRDSKTVAYELNEGKFSNSEDIKKAAYVADAAEIHLNEIYLARLAQQRAKQVDVKELGKMIEKINSNILNDLTKLADKKLISIPNTATSQGMLAAEFLNKKSGHSFDKEYCDMMVVSQKRMIKVFEEIADESSDSEMKIWAFCALPALRKHLDYALICQKKYGSI